MKWPLLILLTVLPLQWFVVAGPLRLHLVMMTFFLVASVVAYRARAFRPVLAQVWPFVAANAALSMVWMATNAIHGLGPRQPVQQLVYLGVFVAVGTAVHQGLRLGRHRWVETLRWSALTSSVALLTALWISMALNGVNAAEVFGRSIAAADPEILQKELFRSAFAGFGFTEDTANGNIRHEVFGSLLVAMTMSAACTGIRPFTSALARRVYLASMALSTILIVISLSRSVILALSVWPLLVLVRAVLAIRISPQLVGGAILGVGGLLVLGKSGLLTVLWVRFTQDTGSYEARDGLLERAFENISTHAVLGGVSTAAASSHNFVLDSWLRAGVVAALLAAAVVVLLIGLSVALTITLHLEPAWMLPVVVMLALPLVRIFTAGGGLIPPVSWVGLGLAAGFLAYRQTLAGRAQDEDAAARPAQDVDYASLSRDASE